MFDEEVLELFD